MESFLELFFYYMNSLCRSSNKFFNSEIDQFFGCQFYCLKLQPSCEKFLRIFTTIWNMNNDIMMTQEVLKQSNIWCIGCIKRLSTSRSHYFRTFTYMLGVWPYTICLVDPHQCKNFFIRSNFGIASRGRFAKALSIIRALKSVLNLEIFKIMGVIFDLYKIWRNFRELTYFDIVEEIES